MIKYVACGVIICAVGVLFIRKEVKNNVCKTFDDYYTDRDNNKNCYYNPDHELTVPEIIKRHGYPVESHKVTTGDGYILNVFRIPHGKRDTEDKKIRKPVFLQHGLGYKSSCFINRGQKSLGFILANNGYDVWLGNFRGSIYSPNHTSLSNTDREYWNYSFHEHGVYDLPSQLGLVKKITKQKAIYIGYSMGATAMYIFGTTYPDNARDTVSFFVNFAPAVFMKNMQSYTKIIVDYLPTISPLIDTLSNGKFSLGLPLPDIMQKILCYPYPFQMKLCNIYEMLNFGFNYEQIDPETLPITFFQNQDWTSLKCASHFAQLSQSDDFRQYDYGEETNIKVYGTSKPPTYDLSKFSVPVYLIRAHNDLSISKMDIEKLYRSLPAETNRHGIYVVKDKIFNHMDFVLGRDVVPLLYDHVVEFLDRL